MYEFYKKMLLFGVKKQREKENISFYPINTMV